MYILTCEVPPGQSSLYLIFGVVSPLFIYKMVEMPRNFNPLLWAGNPLCCRTFYRLKEGQQDQIKYKLDRPAGTFDM